MLKKTLFAFVAVALVVGGLLALLPTKANAASAPAPVAAAAVPDVTCFQATYPYAWDIVYFEWLSESSEYLCPGTQEEPDYDCVANQIAGAAVGLATWSGYQLGHCNTMLNALDDLVDCEIACGEDAQCLAGCEANYWGAISPVIQDMQKEFDENWAEDFWNDIASECCDPEKATAASAHTPVNALAVPDPTSCSLAFGPEAYSIVHDEWLAASAEYECPDPNQELNYDCVMDTIVSFAAGLSVWAQSQTGWCAVAGPAYGTLQSCLAGCETQQCESTCYAVFYGVMGPMIQEMQREWDANWAEDFWDDLTAECCEDTE